MRPVDALTALAVQLHGQGFTHLYGGCNGPVAVLSVTSDVTVWTNGRVLSWRLRGQETRLPAADPAYAVWTLLRLMGGAHA